MLFKDYLSFHHIPFQEASSVNDDIPIVQLRFTKSSMNIALVLLQEGEIFLPTQFRAWTQADYHLISPEEINIVQAGAYTVPAPKSLGLVGFASSSLQECLDIALGLEEGFALLSQQAWKDYCALQCIKIFPSHQVSWVAQPHSNVISVFSQRVMKRMPTFVEFPPLPISAERLIALKMSEKPTVNALIEIIAHDPLLTAQVIMWSHSPLYASIKAVRSVRDAVLNVLGYELVFNLCLSLTMKRAFNHPPYGRLGWERLTYQSFLTGKLARAIAEHQGLNVNLDLVELSGALCDIGYFILGQYFQPHFKSLSEDLEANPKVDPCIIEFEHFHFTHQHLGAWLLKSWNMPYEIVTAVQWHHSLQPITFCDDYPRSVFLARYFLSQHGYGDEFKVHAEEIELNLDGEQHQAYDHLSLNLINQASRLEKPLGH